MLKQRVITALLLLAVLGLVLALPQAWPFTAFCAVALAAAGWEWARLNGAGREAAVGWGGLHVGVFLIGLWPGLSLGAWAWMGLALAWVLLLLLTLRGGVSAWQAHRPGLRCALGLLLLVPGFWALLAWRAEGLNAMFSVLALVWVADIGGYFGGRRWGRRKLAPGVSPGKTWEGAWTGAVAVLLLAVGWVHGLDGHWGGGGLGLYGRLVAAWSGPLALLAVLGLVALSITGDLFESLVKRAAGVKDSSQLLPGHGGVLDRIDALLPVLPVAWALERLARGGW